MKLVDRTYMYPVKSTRAQWIFKTDFLEKEVPLEKIFLYNFPLTFVQ